MTQNPAELPTYGKPVEHEITGVRNVFCALVSQGKVADWQDAQPVRTVSFDRRFKRRKGSFRSMPDAILVSADGRVGVVECKRATSPAAKHGMIEQLLLYCAQARTLDEQTFTERICDGREVSGCPRFERTLVAQRLAHSRGSDVVPVLVVDRWGKTLNSTALITVRFINDLLQRLQLPTIQVYAVGNGRPEVVATLASSRDQRRV